MEIPHSIDESVNFLFWDLEEVIILSSCLGFGFVFKSYVVLISGFVVVHFYGKFRDSSFKGLLLHLAWWFGFTSLNKDWHNGLIREWMD